MGFYGGGLTLIFATPVGAEGPDEEHIFHIKKDDTLPIIRQQLRDIGNRLVPLPAGSTVRFLMGIPDGEVLVDKPAGIVNAALSVVEFIWEDGDTVEVGTFRAEWQVTYPNGTIATVPTKRSANKVKVHAEIA